MSRKVSQRVSPPRGPVPEALGCGRGSGWSVRPGVGGATDIDHRVMIVTHDGPCAKCGRDHGRAIRAHEVIHAQFSPDRADLAAMRFPSPDECALLAEEVRVATIARVLGVDHAPGLCGGYTNPGLMPAEGIDPTNAAAVRDAALTTIRGLVACYGSPDWRGWSVAFTRRYGPGSGHPLRGIFDEVVGVVREAERRLPRSVPRGPRDPEGWYGPRADHSLGGWEWTEMLAERLREIVARYLTAIEPPKREEEGDPGEQVRAIMEEARVTWGAMDIYRPPLTDRGAPPPKNLRRHSEEGVVPTAAHRAFSDGRIFAPRRKRLGASILIDCSGSMDWNLDDLRRVIAAGPASLIATYSGRFQSGTLTIVAAEGRIIGRDENPAPGGHNNLVDGPALAWLASQPAPRVWLSDGQATAVGTGIAYSPAEEARRIAVAGGIARVRTLEGVIAAMVAGTRFPRGRFPQSWTLLPGRECRGDTEASRGAGRGVWRGSR